MQCTARFLEIVYNQPFALYFIRKLLELKIIIITVIEKRKIFMYNTDRENGDTKRIQESI